MILNTGFDGSAVKLAQDEFAWRQSFFQGESFDEMVFILDDSANF